MKINFFLFSLAIFIISASLFAKSRVVDSAGLLSAAEAASIQNLADTISETYDFDLVIVTENDIGNAQPMDYADDFFDYNGYGLGQDRDGCLFLIVMGTRDYWFSTSGRGIGIFNAAATEKLEKDALNFLRKNDFYNAFAVFAKDWETFLVLDAKGRHYNVFYEYNVIMVVIAWLVSLGIGFLIVVSWKKNMNTALQQTQAAAYVIPGSLSFTVQQDQFLYSSVSRTARENDSGSSGGVHTSSSGRSHGGHGGKF
jgi:uncharacterized protein